MASVDLTSSPTPVILWCVPRSVSTATERAFMTRDDTRCLHEPLGDPFYFSSKRQSLRYSEQECKDQGHWDKDIVDVMESFLSPAPEGEDSRCGKKGPVKYVFIKDMAQYIIPQSTLKKIHQGSQCYQTDGTAGSRFDNVDAEGEIIENPTVIPTELMKRFKHTFLVRTPEKAVPSYWKCVQDKMAGFEFFDGAEAGFEEVRILYKWISNPKSTFNQGDSQSSSDRHFTGVVQKQPQPPPLIDASVLLADPTATIKHLCEATGIPFDPAMLSWDAKPQAEFAKWGDYHKGAENSTGFKAESKSAAAEKKDQAAAAPKPDLPKEVQDTIARNMEPYNWLFARKTISA